MKKMLLVIFLLTILLNLLSYVILPDKVAIHFSKGGHPDAWANKETNFLIFVGLDILLFLLFWYSPTLMMKSPEKWVSLPNKSFWLTEKNKAITIKKLESLMSEFGIALFAFFFFISIIIVDANLSDPVKLNESVFLPFLILFLIYTVYWTIKLIISFRLPKKVNN